MSFRHQVTKIFKLRGDEQISGESTEKKKSSTIKTELKNLNPSTIGKF